MEKTIVYKTVSENRISFNKMKGINKSIYNAFDFLFVVCGVVSFVSAFTANLTLSRFMFFAVACLSFVAWGKLESIKKEIFYPSAVFPMIRLNKTLIKEDDGTVAIPPGRWIKVEKSYKYSTDGGSNWKMEPDNGIQQIKMEREILFQSNWAAIVSKYKFKKTKIGKTIA